jgi:hypothetical protein
VGNDGYRGFMGRILRAYGRRIGAGDIAALPELVALEADLAATIEEAVRQLRHEPHNYSWSDIGKALGISRQAAMKRWGHVGGSRIAGGQPSNLR